MVILVKKNCYQRNKRVMKIDPIAREMNSDNSFFLEIKLQWCLDKATKTLSVKYIAHTYAVYIYT